MELSWFHEDYDLNKLGKSSKTVFLFPSCACSKAKVCWDFLYFLDATDFNIATDFVHPSNRYFVIDCLQELSMSRFPSPTNLIWTSWGDQIVESNNSTSYHLIEVISCWPGLKVKLKVIILLSAILSLRFIQAYYITALYTVL